MPIVFVEQYNTEIEFPDEMSEEQINSVLAEEFPALETSQESRENIYDKETDSVIDAPVGSPGDLVKYYDDTQNGGRSGYDYTGYGRTTPEEETSYVDDITSTLATPVRLGALGIAQGFSMVSKAVAGGLRLNKEIDILGIKTEDQQQFEEDFLRNLGARNQRLSSKLQKRIDEFKTGSFARDLGVDVITAVPQIPFYVGATVSGGPVGLYTMVSTSTFEDTYQEAVRAGKSNDEAVNIALPTGAIIGALNTAYVGRIMQVAGNSSKSITNKILVNTGNGFIGEASEAVAESVILNASGVRDNTAAEAIGEILYEGLVGGLTFGIGTPGLAKATTKLEDAGVKNVEEVIKQTEQGVIELQDIITKTMDDDINRANDNESLVTDTLDLVTAMKSGDWQSLAASMEAQGKLTPEVQAKIDTLDAISQQAAREPSGEVLPEAPAEIDARITEDTRKIENLGDEIDRLTEAEAEATPEEAEAIAQQKQTLEAEIKRLDAERNLLSDRMADEIAINGEISDLEIAQMSPNARARAKEVLLASASSEGEIEAIKDRFDNNPLVKALDARRTRFQKLKDKAIDMSAQFSKSLDRILTPISTRLDKINPVLGSKLKNFEAKLHIAIENDARVVNRFLRKYKSLSSTDQAILDIAMRNGDQKTIEELAAKNDMSQEFSDIRESLDDMYNRATEAGMNVGYREDFYPRVVSRPEAFLEYWQAQEEWGSIDQALQKKSDDVGRELDVAEKAQLINTLLRGYKTSQITLTDPSAVKKRKFEEIPPELHEFYETSVQSLTNYVTQVNTAIEQNKFFGKGIDSELINNVDESIGHFILQSLGNGEINLAQENELRQILAARFNQRAMNPILRAYKNVQYVQVMGGFKSALTQMGDFYTSMYNNGLIETSTAITRQLTGKTEVTKQDLGIDVISSEFTRGDLSGKAVDIVFTANLLKAMDSLGKNTLINSSLGRFRKEAKKPSKEFRKKLELTFEEETDAVLDDLRNNRITDNVKVLLFNELSNFQPISLSEMPEAYLSSPNGRVLYMLKTFTIKHLDIVRREVFDQIKTNPKQASKNFMKLAFFYMAMGATSDEMKDLLLNRSSDFSDSFVDNALKFFGASKYQLAQVEREGFLETVINTVKPPTKVPEDVRSIPVIGEVLYFWMKESEDDEESQEEREETLSLIR